MPKFTKNLLTQLSQAIKMPTIGYCKGGRKVSEPFQSVEKSMEVIEEELRKLFSNGYRVEGIDVQSVTTMSGRANLVNTIFSISKQII